MSSELSPVSTGVLESDGGGIWSRGTDGGRFGNGIGGPLTEAEAAADELLLSFGRSGDEDEGAETGFD